MGLKCYNYSTERLQHYYRITTSRSTRVSSLFRDYEWKIFRDYVTLLNCFSFRHLDKVCGFRHTTKENVNPYQPTDSFLFNFQKGIFLFEETKKRYFSINVLRHT